MSEMVLPKKWVSPYNMSSQGHGFVWLLGIHGSNPFQTNSRFTSTISVLLLVEVITWHVFVIMAAPRRWTEAMEIRVGAAVSWHVWVGLHLEEIMR